jgi:hypothetical protein
MDAPDTTGQAAARIERALDHIEAAQNYLEDACQQLCPIVGLAKEWQQLGELHEKVKAFWHKLNDRTNGKAFHLDRPQKIGG